MKGESLWYDGNIHSVHIVLITYLEPEAHTIFKNILYITVSPHFGWEKVVNCLLDTNQFGCLQKYIFFH